MALAVISVMQTLEQLLHPQHADLRIRKLVKLMKHRLCVLRDFDHHNSCADGNIRSKDLKTEIIKVACKADDIIASNLLDIRNQVKGATMRFQDELRNLIEEIDSVVKQVTTFGKKGKRMGGRAVLPSPQNSPYRNNSYTAAVVGLDDDFGMMKDRLRNPTDLQVVSIVGMGGIGKTTLAKSVYHDPSVAEHFERCAWITVSQECQERELYLGILRCFVSQTGELEEKKSNHQVAESVYKSLKGRRYLVVLEHDNMGSFKKSISKPRHWQ